MTENEIRASMTSEQILLERKLTCEAINGAIAFGYLDTNPPPADDHWLAPFWKIGRERGELEAKAGDRPAPAATYPMLDDKLATLRHAIEEGVKADSMQAMKLMELVEAIGEQFKSELADAAPQMTFVDDPKQSIDEVLPADRRWVITNAVSLIAGYRNCAASETKETMQTIVDYLRAALADSAASPSRTYTTQPGESVMGIALRQCGNEAEWRHVLACNPKFADLLPNDYFPVGTVLTMLPQTATSGQKLTDEQHAVLRLCIVELSAWMRDHGEDLRSQEAIKRCRALLRASSATASDKEGA